MINDRNSTGRNFWWNIKEMGRVPCLWHTLKNTQDYQGIKQNNATKWKNNNKSTIFAFKYLDVYLLNCSIKTSWVDVQASDACF